MTTAIETRRALIAEIRAQFEIGQIDHSTQYASAFYQGRAFAAIRARRMFETGPRWIVTGADGAELFSANYLPEFAGERIASRLVKLIADREEAASAAVAEEARNEPGRPADTAVCKFHRIDTRFQSTGGFVGINVSQGLYVIPAGGGFSCLGFDVAERKRRAVLEWLGKGYLPCELGTVEAYSAYLEAMERGRIEAERTGKICPAELTPEFIGHEGKRAAIYVNGREIDRFTIGRSSGWMPIHIEINPRGYSGGPAVYIPDGATVRVLA